MKRMKLKTRQFRRRRWGIERLESRVVLDAESGTSAGADPLPAGEPFASAEELNHYLVDVAVRRYAGLFGTEASWWYPGYPTYLNDGPLILSANNAGGLEARSGDSFDGTNVQITGVDESDLTKTDGEFLYVASGNRVTIIDAREPSQLTIAAEIDLPNWTNDLYIAGDRLVVMSNQYQVMPFDRFGFAADILPFPYGGPQTLITVYDVTDRSAPALVSETKLDGNLITSRLIGEHVYLVASESLNLPHPQTHCVPVEADDEGKTIDANGSIVTDAISILPPIWPYPPSERCVYESQEEYVARVGDHLAEDVLPSFELHNGSGELVDSGLIASATDINRPTNPDPYSLTSIVVFDAAADVPGPVTAVTEIGDYASTVFVSPENIYLASQSWDQNGVSSTRILQYAITADGADVEAVARGEVPGAPLNQFAMDEHAGYLRIATTAWSPERSSALYVLQREGTDLNAVGAVEGLAPGEVIFAARFLGDQAFLVTFRQIDPLFTIDLSDPHDPQVVGELKIPGFSNYLHPVAEHLILGLGRSEDSAPQVSLFDVADFSDPQRIDQATLPAGGWTWSEAFHNHHAVSYFADAGVLVVPFDGGSICLAFGDSCAQRPGHFWVLGVEAGADDPLRVLGSIEQGGQPRRSLRIGENLFTVSSETIAVHPLRDPETKIDELYYGSIAHDDYVTADVDLGEQAHNVLINDHATDSLTIVELGAPTSGGEVAISEDGRSVLYTPPADNAAWSDSFSYTVEGGGRRGTATVYVQLARTTAQDKMSELSRQDLAARLEVDAASIRIFAARNATWNDSCLGISNPDLACAQVLTPGFQVTLTLQNHSFEYHTDEDQTVVLAQANLVLGDDRFEAATDSGERRLPVLENDQLESLHARIVSVSEARIGSVRIADDGRALIYLPGDDSSSNQVDEFSYEVEVVDGIRGRGHVNVGIKDQNSDGYLVRVRAEVLDANGQVVSNLQLGDAAVLNLYVEDLRPDATGVFAVYADVEFDPALAGELGEIDHGRLFVNHTSGAVEEGLLNEVGGVSLVTDEGDVLSADQPGEFLFASISFIAQHTGQLTFAFNPADLSPENDTLLLDLNEAVPAAQIDFVSATVDVGSPWRNHTDPRDATGDGVISPRDVLVLINYLNAAGTRRLDAELARTTFAAAPDEPLMQMDVNGDGYISPLDALIIINALRTPVAEGESAASVVEVDADSLTPASGLVVWTPHQSAVAEQPAASFRPHVIAEVARGLTIEIETAAVAIAEHVTEKPLKPREFDAFFAELEVESL